MESSSGSSTVTITARDDPMAGSQQLSSSTSSLSPNRRSSSEISKIYKHASQLFITRRFPEALSMLEPVITPIKQTNGYKYGDEDSPPKAPIATATTNQRIKVWVLYITLLNSIVDLGHDEGRRGFGQARYKAMVNCVRNGDIWETVVRDGYAGKEGSVDSEVVYNLATLLLGQAPSQSLTQSRLETYLASSSDEQLDMPQHFDQNTSHRSPPHVNGAETPKDLNSRLKILELFTLHVLPRNDEWDYAWSFISMSDVLDDERREAFLQSLQELQDVKEHDMQGERASFQRGKDAQLQDQLDDQNRREAEKAASERHKATQGGSVNRRTSSEVDYGIDKKGPSGNAVPGPKALKSGTPSSATSATRQEASQVPSQVEPSRNRNTRKSSQKRPPAYVQPVRNFFRVMQNLIRNMATSIGGNPTTIFKILLSVLAIIMAFGRRDIRERAKRILGSGWDKVRTTAGMGVKVSYM